MRWPLPSDTQANKLNLPSSRSWYYRSEEGSDSKFRIGALPFISKWFKEFMVHCSFQSHNDMDDTFSRTECGFW